MSGRAPLTVAGLPGVRAAIFDFNGTITDDEQLQYEIYAELAAEVLDRPLGRDRYFTELAGRSDPGIVDALLDDAGVRDDADRADRRRILLAERLRRYADRVADRPPVRPGSAALIRALYGRLPLAVATGAFREEVRLVLSESGLADAFDAIVSIEDVRAGKPDPEGFRVAFGLLNDTGSGEHPGAGRVRLEPQDVVVFEDSVHGIAAARAAGMRCVAAHLAAGARPAVPADATVDALGPELIADP